MSQRRAMTGRSLFVNVMLAAVLLAVYGGAAQAALPSDWQQLAPPDLAALIQDLEQQAPSAERDADLATVREHAKSEHLLKVDVNPASQLPGMIFLLQEVKDSLTAGELDTIAADLRQRYLEAPDALQALTPDQIEGLIWMLNGAGAGKDAAGNAGVRWINASANWPDASLREMAALALTTPWAPEGAAKMAAREQLTAAWVEQLQTEKPEGNRLRWLVTRSLDVLTPAQKQSAAQSLADHYAQDATAVAGLSARDMAGLVAGWNLLGTPEARTKAVATWVNTTDGEQQADLVELALFSSAVGKGVTAESAQARQALAARLVERLNAPDAEPEKLQMNNLADLALVLPGAGSGEAAESAKQAFAAAWLSQENPAETANPAKLLHLVQATEGVLSETQRQALADAIESRWVEDAGALAGLAPDEMAHLHWALHGIDADPAMRAETMSKWVSHGTAWRNASLEQLTFWSAVLRPDLAVPGVPEVRAMLGTHIAETINSDPATALAGLQPSQIRQARELAEEAEVPITEIEAWQTAWIQQKAWQTADVTNMVLLLREIDHSAPGSAVREYEDEVLDAIWQRFIADPAARTRVGASGWYRLEELARGISSEERLDALRSGLVRADGSPDPATARFLAWAHRNRGRISQWKAELDTRLEQPMSPEVRGQWLLVRAYAAGVGDIPDAFDHLRGSSRLREVLESGASEDLRLEAASRLVRGLLGRHRFDDAESRLSHYETLFASPAGQAVRVELAALIASERLEETRRKTASRARARSAYRGELERRLDMAVRNNDNERISRYEQLLQNLDQPTAN